MPKKISYAFRKGSISFKQGKDKGPKTHEHYEMQNRDLSHTKTLDYNVDTFTNTRTRVN